MNTIIERNVKIGDNVVIGAGSVVTKDCESNGVYAGVPAKKLAQQYYDRFEQYPNPEIFHEYFMLFETESEALLNDVFSNKLELGDTKKLSIEYMKKYAPEFSNYEEFMRYCFNDEEEK